MLSRRIGAMLTVIAAVIVFGAAVYVIVHKDPVAGAGQTPGYSASLTSAGSSSAAGSDAPSASGTSALARPVIAFLGDDYTLGKGASPRSKRFSTLVCAALKATEKNIAADGAGYAKSGTDGKSYRDLVPLVVAAHPDMVVVSGGRNDTSDDPGTLTAAAAAVFATLRQKLPRAVLVAVAPFWGDSDAPPELAAVDTAVQAGVTAANGAYLDLPDPLHGHASWMSDAADPNDKGYAAIAAALEPKLAPLVPAPSG